MCTHFYLVGGWVFEVEVGDHGADSGDTFVGLDRETAGLAGGYVTGLGARSGLGLEIERGSQTAGAARVRHPDGSLIFG